VHNFCNTTRRYFIQASHLHAEAATAWSANDTVAANSMYADGKAMMSKAVRTAGIDRFCEMAVLLMVVLAFCIVAFRSLRVVSSALRLLVTAKNTLNKLTMQPMNAAHLTRDRSVPTLRVPDAQQVQLDKSLQLVASASRKGRQLQQKVVFTFLFVFLTCLLRSAFQSFYGLAQDGSNHGSLCAASPCDPCKNQWTLISFWIVYTPALQNIVILIASPVALLVALWGMADVGEIEQMSQQ
jgi:hypothetical protein